MQGEGSDFMAISERSRGAGGVSYTAFIVPGLIMMSVLQNAFANTASSLIQAKIAGHPVFVLMPAIPGPQMASAYIGAKFERSFLVGAELYAACAWRAMPSVRKPFLLIAFAFFGAAKRIRGRALP